MRAFLARFRAASSVVGLAGGVLCYRVAPTECHGGHDTARIARLEKQVEMLSSRLEAVSEFTGQGDAIFSWDVELTNCFPKDAEPFEKDMHGGFNEDPKTGIVYTGIPGYGLCSISPDLKTWTRLGTDERLRGNIHGIVVFEHKGQTNIAVAQNEDQRVLIIGLDGEVKQQLSAPVGGEFDFGEANVYYSERPIKQCPWGQPHLPKFACTDVTYLDGKLYVVTGYCDGDFVLTANEEGGQWRWGHTAWGGKGSAAGKFRTAHGVFAYDGHIFVANREAHQVLEFTPDGSLVRALPDIPDTARVCNVARADDYFVMNALEPIQHTPAKTAPIFAHSGERLLSIVEPGELGIPVLKHLHHTWPHYVTAPDGERTLYLLIHGWSAGKFCVLRHEPNGIPSQPNCWRRSQVKPTEWVKR
uniref:Uncharacterized protein n=1 Tax=Haptolina ericina TaxID=156174 RepID=A0A7S3ESD9_9EUKA|mmetsp:Transcript_19092/g.42669  ORF Transcript_19092/g.42669 Transcript_19092/m.42669 type:complete len:415 (+) Transcript_19092:32-1276(+)